MSKHDCRTTCAGFALTALALAVVAGAAGAQTRAQMQHREKKLVEAHKATYRVTQGDKELGSEVVTVRTYNTNTVVYEGSMHIQYTEEIGYDETTRLEVEEDSRFPRTYATTREMRNGDTRFTQAVSVEMFGNVAVVDTKLRESSEQRRFVVPAGTSFIETGVLHLFEPLLEIYNEELGGRQAFPAMDALTGHEEQVVVQRVGAAEAGVGGQTVPATLYTVDREKYSVKLFVDADRRLVRGEMTMMVFELVSWENEAGAGE